MRGAPFRIALLEPGFEHSNFASGSIPLDRYLRNQASQDIRRRVAACFAALADGDRIAGYYTLASASIALADLPADVARRLPRYPTVPAVRMGRLAVDQGSKGIGLGAALLADALERIHRSEIASYALVVDAKDDEAATFYRHHGFVALPDNRRTLFLPMATWSAALKR